MVHKTYTMLVDILPLDSNEAVAGFWAYSLRVYAQPEIAAACLTLQDIAGLDVNCLLYALWLADVRGYSLDETDWRDRLEILTSWQAEITIPLRALRRALKAERLEILQDECQAIRQQIAVAECAAEQIAQRVLVRLTSEKSEIEQDCMKTSHANASLQAYLCAISVTLDDAGKQAIEVLSASLNTKKTEL